MNVELCGITKSYGGTTVLTETNLVFRAGEITSLLGPSGSGKTTLLNIIAGLVEPSSGVVRVGQDDVTGLPAELRRVGYVFQSHALFPHLDVAGNIGFALRVRGVPRHRIRARVDELLTLIELDAFGRRPVATLSGGQRQRVALARALVIRPPVLLLDEPLSNLDAQLREEMQFELRAIQRQTGTTTIMVTHDQAEALSISDRVVVMQDGRATQVDAPYRMYEHPQTQFISRFVGKTNMLPGTVTRAGPRAEVSSGSLAVQVDADGLRAGDTVHLSLRPEKLLPVAEGQGKLDGRVATRYFLGSQWQYELDTALGQLTMVSPNDGRAPLADGQVVGLDWSGDTLRVLRAEA